MLRAKIEYAAKKVCSLISQKLLSPLIKPALQAMLDWDAKNIPRMCQIRALEETVDYIHKYMRSTHSFSDSFALIEHALGYIKPSAEGLICEFGVFQGSSLRYIASKVNQQGAHILVRGGLA